MRLSNRGVSYWLLGILFLSLSACGNEEALTETTETLPYYNEATFTPHWFASTAIIPDTFHRIAPFTLTNQEGETVTETTFAGKIYVADFFFTICPGICPRMTKNMGALQDLFIDEPEVLLLSHSVMPTADSVPVLKEYAISNGVISDKWHLVTGPREEIYTLGRRAYFVEEDLGLEKPNDEFLHTENFVLVDQQGFIRGIYNGLNTASIAQLSRDVRQLLLEG